MTKIFKYVIPLNESCKVEMPERAEILSVQNQNGAITLWARVDPDAKKWRRSFYIYGTGYNCDGSLNARYLASVQIDGYVWHVFTENEFLGRMK